MRSVMTVIFSVVPITSTLLSVLDRKRSAWLVWIVGFTMARPRSACSSASASATARFGRFRYWKKSFMMIHGIRDT